MQKILDDPFLTLIILYVHMPSQQVITVQHEIEHKY